MLNLIFIQKCKGTRLAEILWKKENKFGGIIILSSPATENNTEFPIRGNSLRTLTDYLVAN